MTKNIKIIIAIAIGALVVGFGGYFIYKNSPIFPTPASSISTDTYVQPPENNATTQPKAGPPLAETLEKIISKEITILPGYKSYKNSEFGFEIQYPNTWTISEENIENVRGENTEAFYFKKPNSDLRFAILPRDGLSYGLPDNGASSDVLIGGFPGVQQKWTLPNGRRLWLLHPQYGLHGWSEDIGRIDIQSSAADPSGDTIIFEQMLNSFKLSK